MPEKTPKAPKTQVEKVVVDDTQKAEPGAEAAAAESEATGQTLVVEHDGVKYTIDRTRLDDVELLEAAADLSDGHYRFMPRVLRITLGEEQWNAFKRAHRDPSGRVPTDAMDELFAVVNTALGE